MLEKYVGQIVEIVYLDRKGKLSHRRIEVHRVQNGLIRATCLQTVPATCFSIRSCIGMASGNQNSIGGAYDGEKA